MTRYGLLIDHEWCTGCHSCEMACQMEHAMPVGQCGILVKEIGPWQIDETTWQYGYLPVPTRQCDLCADRTAKGKAPTCVQHCQARCMEYGPIEELSRRLAEKPEQALFCVA